jgi:hypothetical protein
MHRRLMPVGALGRVAFIVGLLYIVYDDESRFLFQRGLALAP